MAKNGFHSGLLLAGRCRQGQAAVEAMVYVGIFLFITVFFSLFLMGQQAQDLRGQQYRLASEVAGQISDQITLAALAGPGFNATFKIPPDVMGRPYAANLTTGGTLYITVKSPRDFFNTGDVQFYYPIGARGDIANNPAISGSGMSNTYQGSDGRFYRAVWFNTSKGTMTIWVENDGKIVIG